MATTTPSFYGNLSGNSTSADKVNNKLSIAGKMFDGSEAISISTSDLVPEETISFSTYNSALTASNHEFTWTIAQSTHQMTSGEMIVRLYDASGNQVFADVKILDNLSVVISLYDESATTISANTYKVVIIGKGVTPTIVQNASTGVLSIS